MTRVNPPILSCFLFLPLLIEFSISVQPEVESVPAGGSLVVQAGAPVTLKCKVNSGGGGSGGVGVCDIGGGGHGDGGRGHP